MKRDVEPAAAFQGLLRTERDLVDAPRLTISDRSRGDLADGEEGGPPASFDALDAAGSRSLAVVVVSVRRALSRRGMILRPRQRSNANNPGHRHVDREQCEQEQHLSSVR